jgi:hypothetical protein
MLGVGPVCLVSLSNCRCVLLVMQSVCVCWAGFTGAACDVPAPRTNEGSRMGVGLTGVAYWSTQHAFGDLMYVQPACMRVARERHSATINTGVVLIFCAQCDVVVHCIVVVKFAVKSTRAEPLH